MRQLMFTVSEQVVSDAQLDRLFSHLPVFLAQPTMVEQIMSAISCLPANAQPLPAPSFWDGLVALPTTDS